ncbi:MAG: selenium-binding protein SBP56-related protein [Kiloniellaceae bacterium]
MTVKSAAPEPRTACGRRWHPAVLAAVLAAGGAMLAAAPALADETCQSPYMAKITGEEEYVYIWTLGMEGLGDGSDKLVTVDVRTGSPTFGQVIDVDSVGGRNEAHHGGLTDDRRLYWVSGLDSNRIFLFDIAGDPANPKLVKTIDDFEEKSGGVVGPHGAYALPGRVLISGLSNSADKTGRSALVEYTNDGAYIATHWMPTKENPQGAANAEKADGYSYDARVLPRRNVMLSSSFTGWSNYMRPLGDVVKDPEAMKAFGNTMVLWDFHARQPRQVFEVPGTPLEVRWAWGPNNNYAFTSTALTSQIWLVYEDENQKWHAEAVADIGDPATLPLPVDISLSADDSTLFVNSFLDGMTRVFDVTDPHHPKQIYDKKIASQVNMVSQSWDGKRLYYTSSLLANWDKTGDDNEQFLKAYFWDGKELKPRFEIDFIAAGLGRPHLMRFGSAALYN